MTNRELLEKTQLFDGLESTRFDSVLEHSEEVSVPAGEVFIKAGEAADALYVIAKGQCEVFIGNSSGEDLILGRLKEGVYFGEQALLSLSGRRTASVRSITSMQLLRVPRDEILKVANLDRALKQRLESIGTVQLIRELQADPSRLQSTGTLQGRYENAQRGCITQYISHVLDMDVMSSHFQLPDGRELWASRVVDEPMVCLNEVGSEAPVPVRYQSSNDVVREVFLSGARPVGVNVYGTWDSIDHVFALILEGGALDSEQLEMFRGNGELFKPEQVSARDETILCPCMYVQRDEVVHAGETDTTAVMKATGAGSICGRCLPAIREILES